MKKQIASLTRGSTGIVLRLLCAPVLTLGLTGISNAASVDCSSVATADVIVENMAATACGFGDTNNDLVGFPVSSWSVNSDTSDPNPRSGDWNAYFRTEIDPFLELWSGDNEEEANGKPIDLQLSSTGGTNPDTTGTFTFNNLSDAINNPFLVVLKEGAAGGGLYAWYYFEGKPTGPLSGTWNTTNPFDERDLSHLTIYQIGSGTPPQLIPVPAAVWLFGSGLLGLVGVARRRKHQ
jgi:hypothetical protein